MAVTSDPLAVTSDPLAVTSDPSRRRAIMAEKFRQPKNNPNPYPNLHLNPNPNPNRRAIMAEKFRQTLSAFASTFPKAKYSAEGESEYNPGVTPAAL